MMVSSGGGGGGGGGVMDSQEIRVITGKRKDCRRYAGSHFCMKKASRAALDFMLETDSQKPLLATCDA